MTPATASDPSSTPAYFKEIVYAAANEDPRSELAALKLTGADDVLCITASGARPLDLLTALPRRIVSVDFNPAQNHLLRLKMAAMARLDYAEFISFLGINEGMSAAQRLAVYAGLEATLVPECRAFWQERRPLVARGIIYSGIWERNLRAIARLAFLRRRQIDRLLQCRSLEEQARLWRGWDNGVWRALLKVVSNRFLWTHVAKEPGMKLVPRGFDIYRYMHACLNQAASHQLLAEEPFAYLMFYGCYNERVLPWHLRPEFYLTLKRHLNRIEIVTASLTDLLRMAEFKGKFQAFSLSDFSTYCTPEAYRNVWEGVLQAAADQARICERQFLVKADPADVTGAKLHRDRSLEERLAQSDGGIFYTFVCGSLALA